MYAQLDVAAFGEQTVSAANSPTYACGRKYATAYIQFTSITSAPTFNVEVSYDGGTNYDDAIVFTPGSAYFAAAATITPSDEDVFGVFIEGATHLKVNRVGGTSGTIVVTLTPYTGSAMAGMAAVLAAATINEDTAASQLEILLKMGAVQTASPATTAADGDWSWLQTAGGLLWTRDGGGRAAAIATVLDTQMDSLASAGVSVLGTAFDNSLALYRYADFEAVLDYAVNPTAGTLMELYLCAALDGTNYADGGDTTLINTSHYIGGFVLRAVTDPPQRITLRNVAIPQSLFKVHVKNSGGQALAASGNTIKILAYR